jgi:hypothetical protein
MPFRARVARCIEYAMTVTLLRPPDIPGVPIPGTGARGASDAQAGTRPGR